MEWWPAGLLTVLIPLVVGVVVAKIFTKGDNSHSELPRGIKPPVETPTDVILLVSYGTPSIGYRLGDAVYQGGLNYPAGIYKVTSISLLNGGKEPSYNVWGTLVFPGVLSDCVGLQVCSEINRKSQCSHYWHHGPERPAHDEQHVHPDSPKQPNNLVAYNKQSFLTHNYDSRSEDYDAISDTIIRRP